MSGKTLIPVVSIFLLTLAAYLLSMPRLITLEDAGLFQMICHGGGIGHPPGYPLFVLGCQAFVGLPFFAADVFAGNLLSALFASLTCVVVFLVARRLNLTATSAAVAAAGYGLSATFWSQAIIIEVYSLAALMFSICLFFALRFQQTGRSTDLYLLGFFYGLALSNHWPIQGLATPALLLVLQPAWRSLIEKLRSPLVLSGILISLIAGLTPYLSLFQAQPRFAVYGGVDSLSEFFRYLSRAAYNDHSAIAGWQDKGLYQAWILRQSALEFSFWLLPLVLLGCFSSFRVLGRANALALVLLYLGATTLLILLLGFEFNSFRQAIFRPYPIVAYLALAIWLALGTAAATRFLHNWVQARWIRILVPAMVVTVAGISNLPVNYRADALLADSYGRQVLGMLPPDSILFVEGDNGVGPVGYLHHVEGIRPDIELRSWNNLVFANRLTEPEASDRQQDSARKAFIAQTERPVFSNSRHQDPVLHRGLVYQYGGTGAGCDGSSHDFAYLLLLLETTQALTDQHEREMLLGILLDLSRQHMMLTLSGQPLPDEEVQMLTSLQQTFAGKLGSLEILMRLVNVSGDKAPEGTQMREKRSLEALAEGAVRMLPGDVSPEVHSVLEEYRGRIALMDPADPRAAVEHFARALELYPSAAGRHFCQIQRALMKAGADNGEQMQLIQAHTPGTPCDE